MHTSTQKHYCKTTFAGGVNIFHESHHFLSHKKKFAEPVKVKTVTQKEELVAILKGGWFTIVQLAEMTKDNRPALTERLKMLMKEGVVKRRSIGVAYEYTFGRPASMTMTITEHVLSVIRADPWITSRQISDKMKTGKLTNIISRMHEAGLLHRKKNVLGQYVYCIAEVPKE